jgi:nucleoside 2-deoxyribosyltransferase
MKIYLASPLGCSEAGREFYYGTLVPELKGHGYEVLDPWKLTDQQKIDAVLSMPYGQDRQDAWRALNPEIAQNNRKAIDNCDTVLAVLDGVDVGSGTASEIGYAYAQRKLIVGYRSDFRLSADNEGSIVNLQVEYFVRQSGGDIINSLAGLWTALAPVVPLAHALPKQTPAILKSGTSISPGKKRAGDRAEFVIISLLLALIVRAALESAFRSNLQDHHEELLLDWVLWLQLLLFCTMMVRFYLGATRYIDTEPTNIGVFDKTVNCIFSFLLFCVFYAIGLSITTVDFYFGLFVLHCVDVLWFLIVLTHASVFPAETPPGDIRPEAIGKIMRTFLGLSLGTIVFALILYGKYLTAGISEYSAEIVFMIGLIAISIFDFVYLREYYFYHEKWVSNNTVP